MKKTILFAIAALALSVQAKAENWMARLSDNQYVATVSIPGTHDSATGSGFNGYFDFYYLSKWRRANVGSSVGEEFARAQDITIEQQWNIGIRAFDLRPDAGASSDYMTCNHGGMETTEKFEDVLTQLCGYLSDNPTEFIIVHLLQGTGNNYVSRVEAVLQRSDFQQYIISCKPNLTVGEARGKMIILAREWHDWDTQVPLKGSSGSFRWWSETEKVYNPDQLDSYIVVENGVTEAHVGMQDLANTTDSEDQERKKTLMTDLLDWSTQHITPYNGNICWIFNFASAYNKTGSYKYGTITIAKDISTSDGYRSNATIMNKLVVDYLASHTGPTGVILMDFAGVATTKGYDGNTYTVYGDEAVQAIIDNNFKRPSSANPYLYNRTQDFHWLHRGSATIADYNNDGRMDFYCSGEQFDWQVKGLLYTQQADGSFTEEETSASSTGAHGLPRSVYSFQRWIDFNNDGNLDFFVNTRGDNDLGDNEHSYTYLYQNGGAASGYKFTLVEGTPFLQAHNEKETSYNAVDNSSASFADYDRDGFVDVVQQVADWTSEGRIAAVFHNNGDGTFTRVFDLHPMSHGSVTFGDLDNDGYPDIVETGWSNEIGFDFYIYKNNGDGTFQEIHAVDALGFTGLAYSDVCLADLNGDGLLDIVSMGHDSNWWRRTIIYMNQGNFTFTALSEGDHGVAGAKEPVIKVADINYDGRPDLIITGEFDSQESTSENDSGQGTRIYLQQTDGKFQLFSRTGLGYMGQGGIAFGDLSGRNTMDAFVVGNGIACTYQLFDAPTTAPSAPTGLKAVKNADGSITITWNAASESGLSSSALSYNVYVKDNESGAISMLLPADPETGRLRTIQDMQNAVRGTLSYTVKPQTGKKFTIGVGAIDPAYVTSAFTTIQFALATPGDVNVDDKVDAEDVKALVSYLLGTENNPKYNYKAADLDGHEGLTIADVTALVNLIVKNQKK